MSYKLAIYQLEWPSRRLSKLKFGCLCLFILGLSMAKPVASSSATYSIFIDPAEDPFLDVYIERTARMSTKDLMTIPKLDDKSFLQYMLHEDDSINNRGAMLRTGNNVFDSLRDDQLTQQPYIDNEWETLAVSGPIVVNYMSNLMVLASKKDFSFNATSGYVYRYIRHPNSFRATLAQVSHDMYNALMGAHTAMDRIQLAIQQVPTHVKNALKLITAASDSMIKSMLPRTLESISRLATESAGVANSTLQQFNSLKDLLHEIIELSESTRSTNEVAITEMEIKRNESMLEQQRLHASVGNISVQYNASKIILENARKDYAEAKQRLIDSAAPTIVNGNSEASTNFISQAINAVFDPISILGCLLGQCQNPTPIVDNSKFENAMRLAEIALAALREAEANHNRDFQQQLAEQNELAKTINKMAMLDVGKLSTEEIVQLLLEATDQIHDIQEQWARMILFFSKLAAQANSTQQIVVKDFVEVVQQAQADNLLVNVFDREFLIEMLKPVALTIESGAHLLFIMAKTYYSISSEHMITQIAGIGKLLTLQTNEERNAHLKQISNNTLISSMKITQLVQKRHALYSQQIQQRQTEYTTYINGLVAFES